VSWSKFIKLVLNIIALGRGGVSSFPLQTALGFAKDNQEELMYKDFCLA